ncbi:FAD-dependent oxidoreductase [Nocardioides humi]|uniref:FAD-dependent oxidoreductase n=1 Tax=Nocardioides humi TaxID=449461 RepID=A0ABN2BSQ8_9ACTN|nr:FAD-dependent oxidoreductase [Nocardioides humi]
MLIHADVVVLGTGVAGHAAALVAADRGADVLVLERGPTVGGSSRKAGGGFLFAGTDHQARAGFTDTPDALREDLLAAGRGDADPATVDTFVAHQLATYRWLGEQGVDFTLLPTPRAGVLPRIHDTVPGAVVEKLHERLTEHPSVRLITEVDVQRLVRRPGGERRVTGLEAETKGRLVSVVARSIVLATGGFSQSRDLVRTFAPDIADAVPLGGPHNDGGGLRLACSLGARLRDMGNLRATFGASLPGWSASGERVAPRLLYPVTRGAVLVNRRGERFVSEDLHYKLMSSLCAAQPGAVAFQVFDVKVMRRGAELAGPLDFAGARRDGALAEEPDLTRLAERIDVPADALVRTIGHYNDAIEAGRDLFGRAHQDFGEPGGARVEESPFFAFPCTNALTTTFCGVAVDRELRVVDVFDEAIEGLHAAGELVGGLHGSGYLSGSALSAAATLGRAAGLSVTA